MSDHFRHLNSRPANQVEQAPGSLKRADFLSLSGPLPVRVLAEFQRKPRLGRPAQLPAVCVPFRQAAGRASINQRAPVVRLPAGRPARSPDRLARPTGKLDRRRQGQSLSLVGSGCGRRIKRLISHTTGTSEADGRAACEEDEQLATARAGHQSGRRATFADVGVVNRQAWPAREPRISPTRQINLSTSS